MTKPKQKPRSVSHGLRRRWKMLYWRLRNPWTRDSTSLFIMGCQRSGTTMLLNLFDRDFRSRRLGEKSCLTGEGGTSFRLRSLEEVHRLLAGMPEPLVVVKPIVESQRTREILDQVPNSRAIWLFRDYRDVANSDVNRFKSQVANLQVIVENSSSRNWRSEFVPADVREALLRFFDPSMSPYDAAALFWFVRNRLYFDLDLASHQRTFTCKYEGLVTNPSRTMQEIYGWLGLAYPGDQLVATVSTRSVALGRDIPLGPEVRQLCQDLMDRLDACLAKASPASSAATSRAPHPSST